MNEKSIHYYYGEDALQKLITYCQQNRYSNLILVCDDNTYRALGNRVEAHLQAQSWSIKTILLKGQEIIADEKYLQEVLDQSEGFTGLYLAIGAGTITDITRYCSFFRNSPFISLPTAPSVDGFASVVAPIVVKGFKGTAFTRPPIAIFADTHTLCTAPHSMIAAGFGDMLGKFTALADWQLDHLIWEEPYNSEIAERMRSALIVCVEHADEIQHANPNGIRALMNGLVESGICMADNGNSRPASGSEHHLSHFWEMQLLRQGKPAILHGAKVGVGTVLIAQRWRKIASLSQDEFKQRLAHSHLPTIEQEIKIITAFYGNNAEQVIKEQERFLKLSKNDYAQLEEKIANNRDKIHDIAVTVPSPAKIVKLLKLMGGPTRVADIGMENLDEKNALHYAHYLRNQFTVCKLGKILGLWE